MISTIQEQAADLASQILILRMQMVTLSSRIVEYKIKQSILPEQIKENLNLDLEESLRYLVNGAQILRLALDIKPKQIGEYFIHTLHSMSGDKGGMKNEK